VTSAMADRKMLQQVLQLVEEQAEKMSKMETTIAGLVVSHSELQAALSEVRRATTVPSAPEILEDETTRRLTKQGPSLTMKWIPPDCAPNPVLSYTVEADDGSVQGGGFQVIYDQGRDTQCRCVDLRCFSVLLDLGTAFFLCLDLYCCCLLQHPRP